MVVGHDARHGSERVRPGRDRGAHRRAGSTSPTSTSPCRRHCVATALRDLGADGGGGGDRQPQPGDRQRSEGLRSGRRADRAARPTPTSPHAWTRCPWAASAPGQVAPAGAAGDAVPARRTEHRRTRGRAVPRPDRPHRRRSARRAPCGWHTPRCTASGTDCSPRRSVACPGSRRTPWPPNVRPTPTSPRSPAPTRRSPAPSTSCWIWLRRSMPMSPWRWTPTPTGWPSRSRDTLPGIAAGSSSPATRSGRCWPPTCSRRPTGPDRLVATTVVSSRLVPAMCEAAGSTTPRR